MRCVAVFSCRIPVLLEYFRILTTLQVGAYCGTGRPKHPFTFETVLRTYSVVRNRLREPAVQLLGSSNNDFYLFLRVCLFQTISYYKFLLDK